MYMQQEQNAFHAINKCSLWSTPSEHSNIYAALMGHHHLEHEHTQTAMSRTMQNSHVTHHASMHAHVRACVRVRMCVCVCVNECVCVFGRVGQLM